MTKKEYKKELRENKREKSAVFVIMGIQRGKVKKRKKMKKKKKTHFFLALLGVQWGEGG